MTIALQNFTELDSTKVVDNLALITSRLSEENESLDLRPGVLYSIVAYCHALLDTQLQAKFEDYLNARSLLAIQTNPALALPELVDDVASNYLITRKSGKQATGNITIVLSSNVTATIGVGAVFEGRGKQFVTERTYTAKLEADQVVGPGDRLLTKNGANWSFQIPVIAVDEGSASEIRQGTIIAPVNAPRNYVTSFATADFTGGYSSETNEELIKRLQTGITAKTVSNRLNMEAFLRNQEAFAYVTNMSIIGLGDAEMQRDKHTVWPMSFGARVDWYIRTREQVAQVELTVSAALISKNADATSVWQFTIDKPEVAGFFEVRKIQLATAENFAGTFSIVTDTRTMNLPDEPGTPDVVTAVEAVYSAYQVAVIQFTNTVTDVSALAIGAKLDYTVTLASLPTIADLQAFVSSTENASVGADCLIKAPVPCFVSIRCTLNKPTATPAPDLVAIKDAISRRINSIGFVGKLYASQVYDVINPYLTNTMSVSLLDLHGRLRYPNGDSRILRDAEVLTVPTEPENLVTARTVQFFTLPEDIDITVVSNALG